jgi:hypothetical protein
VSLLDALDLHRARCTKCRPSMICAEADQLLNDACEALAARILPMPIPPLAKGAAKA